jgi:hypothetical protein
MSFARLRQTLPSSFLALDEFPAPGVAWIKEAQRHRPALPANLLTEFTTDAAEIAVSGAISGTLPY